jgi:NifU-like protein involved in Fe-S cluster formation
MTLYDYFGRACRRTLEPVAGEPVRDEDGNSAAFSVAMADGRVTHVSYRCTSCATLIALCEHLSELATGLDAVSVLNLQPEALVMLHPEIPEAKRPAAALAVEALQSAIRETEPRR